MIGGGIHRHGGSTTKAAARANVPFVAAYRIPEVNAITTGYWRALLTHRRYAARVLIPPPQPLRVALP